MKTSERLKIEKEIYINKSISNFRNRFRTAYKYFLNEYIPLYTIIYGLLTLSVLVSIWDQENIYSYIKGIMVCLIFVSMLTYTTAFFNAILSLKYLSRKRTIKAAERNFKEEFISSALFKECNEEFTALEIENYFHEKVVLSETTNSDIQRYINAKNDMSLASINDLEIFAEEYTVNEIERMKRESPHHFITQYDLKRMRINSEKYVNGNPMYIV